MGSLEGEVIPIDGKNLRGSYDREKSLKALNLVTAWAKENHPTLYKQVKEQFTFLQNADITDNEISQDFRIEKGHHRLEKRRVWAISVTLAIYPI